MSGKVTLDEPPIDRLLREKENEAVEKGEDTLVFLSPDRFSVSQLFVNRFVKILSITTKLLHNKQMIDEHIYIASSMISKTFTEDKIRDIIDDISARFRLIELPNFLKKVKYGFKVSEMGEGYTKFSYILSYNIEDLSYETLRDEFETILMNSFELIYEFVRDYILFIQAKLSEFQRQPLIEVRLLEIRKLFFQAMSYDTIAEPLTRDLSRNAHLMKKKALELIEEFERTFPDLAKDKLTELREFFKIGKT